MMTSTMVVAVVVVVVMVVVMMEKEQGLEAPVEPCVALDNQVTSECSLSETEEEQTNLI